MSNRISRRDWLKLIGGSAVGLMITPIPWKILDETAKWSQNWSWTPVPRNGKINFKNTTCTLCPMACGVRARCVDNQPVSLMGIPNHPISGGGLCAIGLGGHLLPYHPARLLQPYKIIRGKDKVETISTSYEESMSEVIRAVSSSRDGSVAILDGQPQRTISFAYRKFLAGLPNGIYIIPPTNGGVPSEISEEVLNEKDASFGYDIENARTILSFGAAVLDGWGTLGQFSTVVKNRTANDGIKIIQVESIHSRTAQLADEWIPVKPGTEAAFALAIANVTINEKLCDTQRLKAHSTDFENASGRSFVDLAGKFSPSIVSDKTGISEMKIMEIARELAAKKTSLVVSSGSTFSADEQIIFMDMNILLGAAGTKGGLVRRSELPVPLEGKLVDETLLSNVPDHSVKVLILDGTESGNIFPWQLLRQKLVANNPVVVSLSPYFSGIAAHADYLIPSPAYLESYNDSPTPASAAAASYSISTPILPAPKTVMGPLDVIKRLAAATQSNSVNQIGSLESLLKIRTEKIFKQRKGIVFDASTGETTRLTNISSSEKLMSVLSSGGCWYENDFEIRGSESGSRYSFLGGSNHGFEKLSAAADRHIEDSELVLLPYAASVSQSHQLMSKLDKESDLREPGNLASINPETANKLRLTDGGEAIVKTETGSSKVKVKFDKAIMPGTIQASVWPIATDRAGKEEENILEICKIENDSTWRITKAKILPA
jgi:anaerobic selenocysteine-containing dehydrogenase